MWTENFSALPFITLSCSKKLPLVARKIPRVRLAVFTEYCLIAVGVVEFPLWMDTIGLLGLICLH